MRIDKTKVSDGMARAFGVRFYFNKRNNMGLVMVMHRVLLGSLSCFYQFKVEPICFTVHYALVRVNIHSIFNKSMYGIG